MEEALDTLIPESPDKPYDIKEVIHLIVDNGEFYEIQESFAANIVIGFARLGGHSVGIVANQPAVLAGVLDIDASEKRGALRALLRRIQHPHRDLRGCARLHAPGTYQEHHGIIRSGAKLLFAYCEATVPKTDRHHTQSLRRRILRDVLQAHSRRCEPGLANRGDRGDGPDGAVNIVFRKELEKASDPIKRKAELVAEYREKFANPFIAAERGYIDDVIEPKETRPRLINALEMLAKQARDQSAQEARQQSDLG